MIDLFPHHRRTGDSPGPERPAKICPKRPKISLRHLSAHSLPTCCRALPAFNRRRSRRRERGRRIPIDYVNDYVYVYDYVHVVCERSEPFIQGGAVNEPSL